MNRDEKNQAIDDLAEKLRSNDVIYLADVAELNVETSNKLRRLAFSRNVSLNVVKNTLLRKAMEKVEEKDFSELFDVLKGNTSIMFSDTGNAPAKLIKEFRKKEDKPVLKAAYVEESVYIGEDKLEALVSLKSKTELIGEVIVLLQSPARNVISGLTSGKATIGNLVKALAEREN